MIVSTGFILARFYNCL